MLDHRNSENPVFDQKTLFTSKWNCSVVLQLQVVISVLFNCDCLCLKFYAINVVNIKLITAYLFGKYFAVVIKQAYWGKSIPCPFMECRGMVLLSCCYEQEHRVQFGMTHG